MAYFAPRHFAPRYFATRYFPGGETFPAQFPGLYVQKGPKTALSAIVAPIPGPELWHRRADGSYRVPLVDPADPNASPIRIMTTDGIKAVRLKT